MKAIEFIGVLCAVYLFVEGAELIQFFKRILGVDNNANPKQLWKFTVQKLINCAMCSGFWFGMLYYGFSGTELWFLWACMVSVGAELFSYLLKWLMIRLTKFTK